VSNLQLVFGMANDEMDIVERERVFHNNRFSNDVDRTHLGKYYGAIWHGTEHLKQLVRSLGKDKNVLEYGCSDGSFSLFALKLPEICASLTGIDISDVAIAKADAAATQCDYKNVAFYRMNGEAMNFANDSFDLVFGMGIIHHLDLEKSFFEVNRVLRPNGVAVFYEPLGHNPIVNLYRRLTPQIRTIDEHPLRTSDFALARRYFAQVDTVFYGMFTVLGVFLGTGISGRGWRIAKALDDAILRLPVIGKYAWSCLLICRNG
jgi:SAM-dependent methyltransferase